MTPEAAEGIGRIGYLIANSPPVDAVGGALLTVLLGWAVQLFADRKRVAWRAYVDTRINLTPAQATRLQFRVYVDETGPQGRGEVEIPWMALLRVRNAGIVPVRGADFHTPLTFTFPGREVRGAEIIDHSGAARPVIVAEDVQRVPSISRSGITRRLRAWMAGGASTGTATAPNGRVPTDHVQIGTDLLLNRRDRFTLMVVLSGTPTDTRRRIRQNGSLIGGRIVAEPPRRGPNTRSMMFGGLVALPLAGLLLGLLVSLGTPAGSSCIGGSLLLEGSTAFAPAAQAVASQYMASCHAAHITVAATGSVTGVNALASEGAHNPSAAIAMSDGPAPAGSRYTPLSGTPEAVIIFSIVVNTGTHLANLTTAQVRDIFDGTYTNWAQIGGPDLPIRIVSRYPDSGSRRTFDEFVLGGAPEPQPSSFDCVDKNEIPAAPVTLCEEPSTQDLLQSVANTSGAIGYAESTDVADAGPKVQPVTLNRLQATFENIGAHAWQYPFWTVEYLYTYGSPASGSLAAKFLGFISTDAGPGKDLIRQAGYTPCVDKDQNLMETLCAPNSR
jgi:phosphate transport system substrate-binding protein